VSINVLIGDGRKLMREGLAVLLSRQAKIHVVGEADDARSAAKLIGPLGANVLLLILPGGAGDAQLAFRRFVTLSHRMTA